MAGLGGLSGPVGLLPFNFVVMCTFRAFLERVPRFKRAFGFVCSVRRSEGGACVLLKEFEAENFSMS